MLKVEVGHVEIAYVEDKPERAAQGVILWLHGGFVSHRAWKPQRDYVAPQ